MFKESSGNLARSKYTRVCMFVYLCVSRPSGLLPSTKGLLHGRGGRQKGGGAGRWGRLTCLSSFLSRCLSLSSLFLAPLVFLSAVCQSVALSLHSSFFLDSSVIYLPHALPLFSLIALLFFFSPPTVYNRSPITMAFVSPRYRCSALLVVIQLCHRIVEPVNYYMKQSEWDRISSAHVCICLNIRKLHEGIKWN